MRRRRGRATTVVIVASLLALVVPAQVSADPGQLIPSFGASGRLVAEVGGGFPVDSVVQSNGRIVVAFTEPRGTVSHAVLRRYRVNGALDSSFGGGTGSVDLGPDTAARALALDGRRIIVGGFSSDPVTSVLNSVVWRLTPSGTLDPTFDGSGSVRPQADAAASEVVVDVAVDSRRRVLVLSQAFGVRHALYRLTGSGSLDSSFAGDGSFEVQFGDANNFPRKMAVTAQDAVVVVGSLLTAYDPVTTEPGVGTAVGRVTASGTWDTSFGGDGTVEFARPAGRSLDPADVAVGPRGRIVVVATDSRSSDVGVIRVLGLTPRGRLDRTFSRDGRQALRFADGVDAEARRLVVLEDGSVIVAGDSVGPVAGVAVLRPNGRPDTRFADDGRRLLRYAPAQVSGVSGMDVGNGGRRLIVVGSSGSGVLLGIAAISLA